MKRILQSVVVVLLLAPLPAAAEETSVLLMSDSPRREALAEAVRVELASRRVAVRIVDPPAGATSVERAANAQRAAREAGALGAIWLEPPRPPSTAEAVRVVGRDTDDMRRTDLPQPVAFVQPRVFAVIAASLLDELTAAPLVSPTPAAPTPPAQADAAARDLPWRRVGVDFMPFVGTSSYTRGREVRAFSLNLPAGISRGVDGFELGFALNLNMEFVRGVQLSGGANLVSGWTRAVQLAGGANIVTGRVRGAQLAGGANFAGEPFSGAALAGGANVVGGDVRGVQMAGGANVAAGGVRGGQLAGGANIASGSLHGAQLAGGANLAFGGSGLQMAPVNVSTDALDGVQIGVVNVAEEVDFALGVVNVFWNGRTHLELTTTETGTWLASLKHGLQNFHYVYSIGARTVGAHEYVVGGLGLGGRIALGERAFLDVDGIAYSYEEDPFTQKIGLLNTLRFLVGYRVLPRIAVVAGVSYNVWVGDFERPVPAPFYDQATFVKGPPDAEVRVLGWPGVTAGVQLF